MNGRKWSTREWYQCWYIKSTSKCRPVDSLRRAVIVKIPHKVDIYSNICKLLAHDTQSSGSSSRNRSNSGDSRTQHIQVRHIQLHTLRITMTFRGKNAVVTGGASGIGLQVCKQLLASEAAKVAIIDVQDNMEDIAKMRAAHPAQSILLIKMDVSNERGMEGTYEEIKKTLGSIDIVVNVAGIFNDKDVQKTLLVNLGGIINSTLAAMKHMSKEHGGNGGIIANMSSVVGLDPMFLLPVYAATKAGIINFTRCLGTDVYLHRTGIKFVTICPGATITDMFTNFTEKILFADMGDESYRVLDRLNKQSAADVARCILCALEKEQNGAVYIIEGRRLFPMEMKRYWRGVENELNE